MNIYCGDLPYSMTENELNDIFVEFGEVTSAKIIIDRGSGRSKGFGFVEMSSQEEGEAAINALNEKEIGGRNIRVNEARPREERPRKSY